MADIAGAEADTGAAAALRAACSVAGPGLHLPDWSAADWRRLLEMTEPRSIPAGTALIRRGATGRALYIVVSGTLEVMAHAGDGMSMGRVARVDPGGVVGEQAFFDAAPRTAGAWAVEDCTVAALTPDAFAAFRARDPVRASDFLFALGRVQAMRLRSASASMR